MNAIEKILFEQLQKHATRYIERRNRGIIVDDLDVDSFMSETSNLIAEHERNNDGYSLNKDRIKESLPSDDEIIAHIENNTRYIEGEPAMDEQTFYEGAKWLRAEFIKRI